MKLAKAESVLIIIVTLNLLLKINALVWLDKEAEFNCSFFYHQEGDINIGTVIPLGCDIKNVTTNYPLLIPFLMAVDEINENEQLLRNITLGFTVFGSCQGDYTQRLLQLLPDTGPQFDEDFCPQQKSHPVWFDVAGMIVYTVSRVSVNLSYIAKISKIPLFTSAEATSDEFTDKSRYPHFFRTVSGDSKQVDFMLSFLQAMNWVYVSVVYTEGPYGENAAKQIRIKAKEMGICIEVFYIVDYSMYFNRDLIDELVEKLVLYQEARVIIGFLEFARVDFEEKIKRRGLQQEFIFLGSDAVDFEIDGLFQVQPIRSIDKSIFPRMTNYFNQRDPKVISTDPWLRQIFADMNNCSWTNNAGNKSCDNVEANGPVFAFSPTTNTKFTKMYDIVYLYAKAIDKLLQNECQSVDIEDKIALRSCVKGDNLIESLKFVEFDGTTFIKIDRNGDAFARWEMYQRQNNDEKVLIGTYDDLKEPKLELFIHKIDWSMFGNLANQRLVIDNKTITTPESVCSHPCKPREYYIQQELPCCWDCRKCHVNEYIVNGTSCEPCPFGEWPEEENATYCVIIEKTYLKIDYWVTWLLLGMSALAFIFTLFTSGFFVVNREKKIIKATSRDLCAILLSGIFAAYITVNFYLIIPTDWSCMVTRHGFNLAVALIYVPLFIKTNRIYRIFKATQSGIGRAKFIDSSTQIIVSFSLILVQVGLSIGSEMMDPTEAVEKMPIETQPYLELYCKLELRGLLIPLVYNLIIILLCAVHGFLTRSLPENFNESKYIFVSVMTTTFLWVVFIPTYFTTFYAYHKSILLATCLILNATITLLLLFIPKIYAVYFVNESKIKYGVTDDGTPMSNISTDHSSTFQYTLKKMAKQGITLEANDPKLSQ